MPVELWPQGGLHPGPFVPVASPPFAEDFSVFLGDFGEQITRADGSTFTAIFDAAYVDPLGVSGATPRLSMPEAVALEPGATVVVRGREYEVQSVQPDGTGWATAPLQRL